MKKLVLALIMAVVLLTTIGAPRVKDANGYPTKYFYYSLKYQDFWELTDSTKNLLDTIYTYKVGGQLFVFNQDGKLMENYHFRKY